MKNIKNIIAATVSAVLLLGACTNKKADDPNYLRVGVQTGPEYVIAEKAKEIAKERFGLEVELVQFNDYIMPNTALNQGDIDINAYQTKPFLNDQSNQRGYKFAIVGNTFVYPMAAYSKKIKTIEELANGSTIVIPNDITNGSRALLLLQKVGLIKLNAEAGNSPRVVDIAENNRNFKIVELEAPQLPRVLDDEEVTLAVINNNFAAQAGLLMKDGVFVEDKESPYVNIIVSREDNKNEEKIKKFVQAFQTDEVVAIAEKEFKGGAVKGW